MAYVQLPAPSLKVKKEKNNNNKPTDRGRNTGKKKKKSTEYNERLMNRGNLRNAELQKTIDAVSEWPVVPATDCFCESFFCITIDSVGKPM